MALLILRYDSAAFAATTKEFGNDRAMGVPIGSASSKRAQELCGVEKVNAAMMAIMEIAST